FSDTPLAAVLHRLGQQTGAPIHLQAGTVTLAGNPLEEQPVTLSTNGQTLGQALRRLAEPRGLSVELRQDVIYLADARTDARQTARIYPVGDLTDPTADDEAIFWRHFAEEAPLIELIREAASFTNDASGPGGPTLVYLESHDLLIARCSAADHDR